MSCQDRVLVHMISDTLSFCHCEERDSSPTIGTGSAISVELLRAEIAAHLSSARNDTPFCRCEADFSQPKQSRGRGLGLLRYASQ